MKPHLRYKVTTQNTWLPCESLTELKLCLTQLFQEGERKITIEAVEKQKRTKQLIRGENGIRLVKRQNTTFKNE